MGLFQNKETEARLWAGLITVLIAAGLFFWLWFTYLPYVKPKSEKRATPEFMALEEIEEEELIEPEEFIEPPQVLEEAREPHPTSPVPDNPQPAPLGEPEPSEVKSDKVVTSGDNPTPNKSAEKLVTQTKPSPVQNTTPSPKPEPESKISGEMKNKFAHNGTPAGKETTTSGTATNTPVATTGQGASVQGVMQNGGNRKMLRCNNKFPIAISKPIKVIVEVTVNDKGKVTKAVCKSSLTDASLKQRLIDESLKSTWTPEAGAPEAKGTITWNLVPATK